MENLNILLIIAYVIESLTLFYLFGMQRTTLIISRSLGVPSEDVAKRLLPAGFGLKTLFTRLAKYGLLLGIWIRIDWKLAIGLGVGSFIFDIKAPIPHRFLYSRIFREKVFMFFGVPIEKFWDELEKEKDVNIL